MIWYLLNIVSIALAWYGRWYGRVDSAIINSYEYRKKRTCIVGTINWILLSGLRGISVGADTDQYKYIFYVTVNTSWSNLIQNFIETYIGSGRIKDPGYSVLEKVFQLFSQSYQVWLIVIAAFFTILMGMWVYKYSENPFLSFLLYSTLFYSFYAITGHRQTIATAIVVFIGTELMKKKKLIVFLAVVILASTIHKSALCVIPFYWVSRIKNSKVTVWIWCGVVDCSYIFRYQLLSVLHFLVGYDNYNGSELARGGTFMLLLLAIGLMVALFYPTLCNGTKEKEDIFNTSVNGLYMACFFSSLLLIFPSAMRVVQYFSIYLMLLMPETTRIFRKNSRRLYMGICSGVLIFLLVLNSPHYVFFWQ